MQNFPNNTQWKDGKIVGDSTKGADEKTTPNPLKRSTINIVEEVPWCIACQSPHSLDYSDVAQSISKSQAIEEEEVASEESHDNMVCNMVGSSYDCESESNLEESNLDLNN